MILRLVEILANERFRIGGTIDASQASIKYEFGDPRSGLNFDF